MAVDTAAGEVEPARFRILGPLEVVRSGCAVPLGGRRQRAVLALLLLEANRVVPVDRLAEDVWGGHPPPGSVTTLHSYVFRLRRALEPDRLPRAGGEVLVTRDRGYLLRVGREHLDAAMFEEAGTAGRAALEAGRFTEAAKTLRAALELWRGPVLADLADYAFARPEAARLEELRLAVVEDRIDADLALGRHHALTGELERLAGEHPLRERLHGQLMLALYRCGRQADALAAYQRVRELLAGELGINPGEPLRRLHQSVLVQDPALDWKDTSPAVVDAALAGRASAADGTGAARVTDEGDTPGVGAAALHASANTDTDLRSSRRHARRLLAAGLAAAVAAAACIVVVARPWAGEASAQLPANTVGLIDSAGGRAGAAVSVGSPDGVAYSDGSVWVVDNSLVGGLVRINPGTHAVVDHIPVGSYPTAVTVSHGDLWVANSGDGTVDRVSPATDAVVGSPIRVGNDPVAIASGTSGVWVANQGDDTVVRINPLTSAVSRPVGVGNLPDGIAVGPDAVWVANSGDGTVTKLDPVTFQPASAPISVGAGPAGIAVTRTAVWVANSLNLTVSKIDPLTGQVTTFPVGDGPSAIVAAKNSVWVSDQFDATLDHIDPRTGRVTRTVPVGSSPRGLALTSAGVWVAAGPFAAASHRGGTLTEVSNTLPAVDPAQGYDYIAGPALATVYDGLVAFRRSPGAAGLTLVPDLAVALPQPTGAGTTYTFTLRRGIRYSTGVPVRASDFRRGIQRELTSRGAPAPAYYQGILGAQACRPRPGRCDLSAGIVVNDAAGTVTFHLTHADPDFLYKLALLFAAPAPPGAPGRVISRAPFLPGTGPYMIASYRPKVSLTLVRNPYFRQWSFAAQPPGYPNVIRFEQIADPGKQLAAVAAGRADLVDITWNGQSYARLATRYPGRVYPGYKVFSTFVFLNTRRPPFSNLKARQAVSYAIDRARIMQLSGRAAGQAAVTCQLLPADFPGYQPYCPYTTAPHDGAGDAPDLATGRRLATESGTTKVPVTVWNDVPKLSSYLVRLLRQLGYRATLRHISARQEAKAILSPHSTAQAGITGFGADIPTPSNYFVPFLSCRSLRHINPNGAINLSWYCNPHADQLARQAQALQPTDPAAARRAWEQLYRLVSNQAPVVPIFSLSPTVFVSARAQNYQEQSMYGPLLDQIWVK